MPTASAPGTVIRGAMIREARTQAGLTRPELAAAAGVHPSTIKRLEKFDIVPRSSWYALQKTVTAIKVLSGAIPNRAKAARPSWGKAVTADFGVIMSAPKGGGLRSTRARERLFVAPPPKSAPRPKCEARTRKGTPCQCKAMLNGRCKFHGGMSTGPRTPEGRERIRQAQLRRWRLAKADPGATAL